MTFPKPDAQSLCAFYGQPWKITSNGVEWDEHFEAAHIMRIPAPYDMWMGDAKITKIAVNKNCAVSLLACLERIAKKTNAKERKEFQIDQFGGGFNMRPIRGVTGSLTVNKVSLHAYGAAIDLAPILNPLGLFYNPAKGMMPHEVIEIFKNEGWTWGGDFKSRPDCMHFQATE